MSDFVNSLASNTLSTAFRPTSQDLTATQQEFANDQLIRARQAEEFVQRINMLDNGSGKYMTLDPGGEGYSLNAEQLIQDGHQGLLLGMLNTQDRFRSAKDEKGRNIQVEAQAIVQDPRSGNYMVEVRRPDGRPAPLTERRSGAPDDPVVQFDSLDINSIGTSAFQDQLFRSGFDAVYANNRATIDAAAYGQASTVGQLREMINSATDQIPDEEARNQLYSVAMRLDADGLRDMADQMGLDVAAIESQASAQFEQQQAARGIPTQDNPVVEEALDPPVPPASSSMDVGVVTGRINELTAIEANDFSDFEYDAARGGSYDDQFEDYKTGLMSEKFQLEQRRELLGARDLNIQQLERDAKAIRDEASRNGLSKRDLVGTPTQRNLDRIDDQIKMAKRAAEYFAQEDALAQVQGAIPLETASEPMTYEQLVTNGLQSAIQGVAESDSTRVREYLQERGVQSATDLAKNDFPLGEALNAIRVIAANSDDPAGTYTNLWNTVATGIEGVSPMELMQQEAINRTADANLTRAQTAARKQIADGNDVEFPDVTDRVAALREAGASLRGIVVGADGRFQDPDQAITDANNIVFEAESIIEDPRIDPADKRDAQRTTVRALTEMLSAKMATNDRAWWDLLGKFSDWLTPNPRAPLGGDVMERVVPDGRGGYTFLTGNGSNTDGDITAQQVANIFGDDAVDIFRELAEFNQKAQEARGTQDGQNVQ